MERLEFFDCTEFDLWGFVNKSQYIKSKFKITEFTNNEVIYYNIGSRSFINQSGCLYLDKSNLRKLDKKVLNYNPKIDVRSPINPVCKVIVNYPTEKIGLFTIDLINKTWRELLYIISDIYKYVYSNRDKFINIYGHSVYELYLYDIVIYQRPNEEVSYIYLSIDS